MSCRTVTLDSEYLKKVRCRKGINFQRRQSCNNTRVASKLMKMKGISLGGGFFPRFAAAALCHNGIVEAASETFWQFVKFVISVNFDGFLGGIHDHVAFVAPMQMFIQLDFQVLADLAVKIIGQLL
jgi:hypothetical protein